jgi:hypothetical protein
MTMTSATINNIETGTINKNNWTGEEDNVRGTYDSISKVINFRLMDSDWKLVFAAWEELDGPSTAHTTDEDRATLFRLIGSGCWVLMDASAKFVDRQIWIGGDAIPATDSVVIQAGEKDSKTPEQVLAQACRNLWNTP